MPDGSATAHTYRPKLATVLAEGYNFDCLRRDLLAALTVAIVALPLSMAIAVASGVSPERGLYAAVIGGFLVSAEKRAGKLVSLTIESERGGPARVRIPGSETVEFFELAPGTELALVNPG